VYGCETRAVTGVNLTRLGTWERKTLRRIHGPVVEQGIWKIRNNK
jgi:hypothetical protein